ncbi:MAG TPA: hypothetical protein VFS64_10150 [Solirubrobacterales bacterium]|nr:hypothetical protein [Solirubrobacterales bacterium]
MNLRRVTLLATGAMLVLVGLALPSIAAAWMMEGYSLKAEQSLWSKEGKTLEGSELATFSGQTKFNNNLYGSVSCNTTEYWELRNHEGGSSSGLSSVSIPVSGCKAQGLFAVEHCAVTAASAQNIGSWQLVAKPNGTVTFENADFSYTLGGCENYGLTELHATGNVTLTPDNSEAIGSVKLSGSVALSVTRAGQTENPNAVTSGEQTVSPGGTFGILKSGVPVSLSGTFKVNNNGIGSSSCSVNGTLLLKGGTEGALSSFGLSECVTGGNWTLKGCEVTSTPQSLPWAARDDGSYVQVQNVSVLLTFSGCIHVSETLTGELSWSVSEAERSAIAQSTTSGTVVSHTGGEYPYTATGTLYWSPSKEFGL